MEGLLVQGIGAERRARRMVEARTGRSRRAVLLKTGEQPHDLALDATLKRAALRKARLGSQAADQPLIAPADLCRKQRYRPCDNLIVLLVDSSDSMGEGAEARMRACKGAVLAILRRAYQQRS